MLNQVVPKLLSHRDFRKPLFAYDACQTEFLIGGLRRDMQCLILNLRELFHVVRKPIHKTLLGSH